VIDQKMFVCIQKMFKCQKIEDMNVTCKKQEDKKCRRTKMRDPSTKKCIRNVFKLMGWCYERHEIRKYVEKQLFHKMWPTDIQEGKYLSLDDTARLFSYSNPSKNKLIQHFVQVSSMEEFQDHMNGNTKYSDDPFADMYIGDLKILLAHNFYIDRINDEDEDEETPDNLVLFDWRTIKNAQTDAENLGKTEDNFYSDLFFNFEKLYKISFTQPLLDD
jgi:hypothetical protein